jgi:hypothetical protein
MKQKLGAIAVLASLTLIPLTGGCTFQQRAIMGQIGYAGTQTGRVEVIATRPGEQGITSFYAILMNNLGPYNIRVRTGTYTVSAYTDTNYNDKQDPNEPFGFYDGDRDGKADEIVVKGEVSGIDITLHDP